MLVGTPAGAEAASPTKAPAEATMKKPKPDHHDGHEKPPGEPEPSVAEEPRAAEIPSLAEPPSPVEEPPAWEQPAEEPSDQPSQVEEPSPSEAPSGDASADPSAAPSDEPSAAEDPKPKPKPKPKPAPEPVGPDIPAPWSAPTSEPILSPFGGLAARLTDRRARAEYLATVIDRATADLVVAAAKLPTTPDGELVKGGDPRWTALGHVLQAARAEQSGVDDEIAALSYALAHGASRRLLALPVSGGVNSGFGSRFDPYYHRRQPHEGLDLEAGMGTPIHAAAPGTVVFAAHSGGYGNLTCLDHGRFHYQSLWTCYAHQSAIEVSVGDRVDAGQTIGEVGTTGASTGPHLHFEVRAGGNAIDPAPWLGLED